MLFFVLCAVCLSYGYDRTRSVLCDKELCERACGGGRCRCACVLPQKFGDGGGRGVHRGFYIGADFYDRSYVKCVYV